MAAKPKYSTVQQHQPIYAPRSWNEEEKRFVRTLQGIFDDIYKRYGRLGLNDLSKVFRGTVSGLEEGLDSTQTNVTTLTEALELLNTTKLAKNEVLNAVYPVGAIYISVSEFSPNELFGGTWEQLKDRFLLAAGDTYEAGKADGEAAHTLTMDEMPSHSHDLYVRGLEGSASKEAVVNSSYNATAEPSDAGKAELIVAASGNSMPHNNMPPYLTVYMWKRTA